jgi:hypothetical protein
MGCIPAPNFLNSNLLRDLDAQGELPSSGLLGMKFMQEAGYARRVVSWTFLVLVPLWCLWKAIKQKREDAKKEALDVLKE